MKHKSITSRNIQKKLESFLNQSPPFQYLVNLLYSLAMVPVEKVLDIYDTVIMDFLVAHEEDEGFLDHQEEINKFFDCTWMGGLDGWPAAHQEASPLPHPFVE